VITPISPTPLSPPYRGEDKEELLNILIMVTINIPQTFKVTEDQFKILAVANRDLRLEKTATGELIVMPPTGGETGQRNAQLSAQFVNWNNQKQLGVVFDSSTAFRLPNGADRSPDVSWVKLERWQQLTAEEQDSFPPLCPDFVLELRSPSDRLETLRKKMEEYLDNGAKLGWLLEPKTRSVEIYRPNQEVEILQLPISLSGENILLDFVLDLKPIWK
jgi:Uma2 family endonuclease